MNGRVHLRVEPFTSAIVVSAAVILSAPVVGQLRSWIRTTFPGRFVLVVSAIGAIVLAAALVAAVVRIRDRRLRRYGAILAAIGVAVLYSAFNASDNPESNAVERFHFLEYGLITFLFYRAWRPLADSSIVVLPILAGLIVGTAEEWLQWFIPNRVGELRDIFLNLAAIASGLLLSAAVLPPDRFRLALDRQSRPRALRMTAATVIAVAIFLHSVHLGYDIEDSEVGSFVSRYSPRRLPALQADAAARWRTDPPPLVLQRISREDQYLSEGLAHVRWRNKQWEAGSMRAAWNENRILEKYYAPVLDTPTYEGRQGHRWPPEQRADAAVRTAASGGPLSYVSGAYPYRIYAWSRPMFWSLVGSLSVVLIGLAARLDVSPSGP